MSTTGPTDPTLPRLETYGTGFHQQVPDGGIDRIPDFDPRTGEHYWVLPVAYRITDPARWYDDSAPAESRMLDLENLVNANAIGCWHCEQPWTPRLAARRCKGQP